MTSDQSKLAAVMRERFGDPSTLERERPTHQPSDLRPRSQDELNARRRILTNK